MTSSGKTSRRALVAGLVLLLLAPVLALSQTGQKTVDGHVLDGKENGIAGAVVYCKDLKTLFIKSFISQKDGSYRFGQLSPTVDYEIWADLQGKKSPVKTVSSFDSKKQLNINLHIK